MKSSSTTIDHTPRVLREYRKRYNAYGPRLACEKLAE